MQRSMPLPAKSPEEWLAHFWQGVTERTRVIFLSHITSATAQRYPVSDVCRRARAEGIQVFVDGAHAPGQVPLDLSELGSDFYTGNCHKWMLAPKGAAFLHVRKDLQSRLDPLVVGWGWSRAPEFETDSPFLNLHQWMGTDDLSSYLAVADAIDFMEKYEWETVRHGCRALLDETLSALEALTGLPSCVAPADRGALQMAIAELPRLRDPKAFKNALLSEFRVEIPVIEWEGRHFVRISIQGYNTAADADALIAATAALLPHHRAGAHNQLVEKR